MKNDLIRKLTSRKFWAAVAGFIAPILLAPGAADSTATKITALIMSGGTLIAYILGEGMIDAEYAANGTQEKENEKKPVSD